MHLEALAPILLRYRYWIIVPLSLLEGPMVAVVTGALSARGYFNPYTACALFVAKDVIIDGVYYYLGRVTSTLQTMRRPVAFFKTHMRLR